MKCEYDITYVNDDKNNNSEWVILLHGIGGSSNMWRRQIALLQDTYNTCAITLPGHGDNKSDVDNLGSNTYKQIAIDIIDYLKALGIKEIYLISVSMGTIVANEMILYEPSFIKKSLLTGAVCGVNRFIYVQAQLLAHCASFLPYRFVVDCCARLILPRRSHNKSRTFLVEECLRMKKEEFIKWMYIFFKNINYVKSIALNPSKCMMVVGDEDYVFIKGNKKLAHRCHLPIYIMHQCGHVCSLHKWREFNQLLMSFLTTDTVPSQFSIC